MPTRTRKIRNSYDVERKKSRQSEAKSPGPVYFKNAAGKVIGFMRVLGKNRTDFFNAAGKLVAREIGGVTYDFRGRLVAWDEVGLMVVPRHG